MKVALVYDKINKWGGAERVLLSLHKIFPDALLYTSVYSSSNTSWARVFKIKTSFLQKIPGVKTHTEFFPFLMPFSFESFSFDGYDLVISVTSEAAKGIITPPKTLHICICLTPTRYLWSGFEVYFRNPFLRYFSKPLIKYLRSWDLVASSRPDYYVAISQEVAKRIRKYYGRESKVIYPSTEIGDKGIKEGNEGYFLVVSRLSKFVEYKKVDLVVDTINQLGFPLKIVGSGSLLKRLKKKANKNIEFLGQVNDEELEELYKNCRAVIFPAVEDFGLVMVEAQAFGKPVIAFRSGGALEIVEEGITGEFFNQQSVSSLSQVLKNFNERRYNTKAIKMNAKRFSFENFRDQLLEFVDEKQKEYK